MLNSNTIQYVNVNVFNAISSEIHNFESEMKIGLLLRRNGFVPRLFFYKIFYLLFFSIDFIYQCVKTLRQKKKRTKFIFLLRRRYQKSHRWSIVNGYQICSHITYKKLTPRNASSQRRSCDMAIFFVSFSQFLVVNIQSFYFVLTSGLSAFWLIPLCDRFLLLFC